MCHGLGYFHGTTWHYVLDHLDEDLGPEYTSQYFKHPVAGRPPDGALCASPASFSFFFGIHAVLCSGQNECSEIWVLWDYPSWRIFTRSSHCCEEDSLCFRPIMVRARFQRRRWQTARNWWMNDLYQVIKSNTFQMPCFDPARAGLARWWDVPCGGKVIFGGKVGRDFRPWSG